MYRVDRRIHRHKRVRRNTITLLVLILGAIVAYWLMHIRITPKQDLQNTPEVTKSFSAGVAEKVRVDKPFFTLELPTGWKERGPEPSVVPDSTYTFQSSGSPAQLLAIYLDATPANMAVNRAIVVSPEGDGLTYNTVSENCTTFTDTSRLNRQTATAPARWQDIDFLCDMGNFNRGVIGTESTEGINTVTVKGPTKGAHKLFIRYTDSTVSPDYSALYGILDSFRVK